MRIRRWLPGRRGAIGFFALAALKRGGLQPPAVTVRCSLMSRVPAMIAASYLPGTT